MFYNFTELCISSLPWKGLETVGPVRTPGWSSLTWGCTMSHERTLPGMLHAAMGMRGEQPVAHVAATPSHHLELHSYHVALKNEKEMGSSYSSLAKNRNISGQDFAGVHVCVIGCFCFSGNMGQTSQNHRIMTYSGYWLLSELVR